MNKQLIDILNKSTVKELKEINKAVQFRINLILHINRECDIK